MRRLNQKLSISVHDSTIYDKLSLRPHIQTRYGRVKKANLVKTSQVV